MKQIIIGLVAIAACATGGWTVYQQNRPVANTVTLRQETDQVTWLCTETGSVWSGEWAPSPAVNPKTGKKTLVQALFCENCQKWYPAPPAAMAERSPRGPTCPKTGGLLTVEGPEVEQLIVEAKDE